MKKIVFITLFIFLLTTPALARYIAPYDTRDINTIEYYPQGLTKTSPIAYGKGNSDLSFINWVIPTRNNIDLLGDGNILISLDKINSEITISLSPDANITTTQFSAVDGNFTGIQAENFFGGGADFTLPVTGIALNEIENLTTDKTFNNGNNAISFNFVAPTNQPTYMGAFEIQASGAFEGHLSHIHQHTGNPGITYLLHVEAEDPDVSGIEIKTINTSLFINTGDVNINTNVDILGDLNTIDVWVEGDINSSGTDNNIRILGVERIFGDGSGLTNVSATADVNNTDVTLANLFVDYNTNIDGDLNVLQDVGIKRNLYVEGSTFISGDIDKVKKIKSEDANSNAGRNSVALGTGTTSTGDESFSGGYAASDIVADGNASFAYGYAREQDESGNPAANLNAEIRATGIGSIAQGYAWTQTITPHANDLNTLILAEGDGSQARGSVYYTTAGFITNLTGSILALGRGSFALGSVTPLVTTPSVSILSSGEGSFSTGNAETANIISSGKGSFAGGYTPGLVDIIASGDGSFSFGDGTQATNDNSTAFGSRTNSTGEDSFTIGLTTTASGSRSFAGGSSSTASGTDCFAFGIGATASASGSVAIGTNVFAIRDNAITLGSDVNIVEFLTIGNGIDMNVGLNTGDVNASGNIYASGKYLGPDTNAATECTDTNSVLNAEGECIIISEFYIQGAGGGFSDYTELYQTITPGTDANWTFVDLSSYGVSDGDIVEIVIYNNVANHENEAGVRNVESALNRVFDLQEAEAGGGDFISLHSKAIGSYIALYEEDDSDMTSYLIGYWS